MMNETTASVLIHRTMVDFRSFAARNSSWATRSWRETKSLMGVASGSIVG
ncbi:hypothetical protein EDC40_104592 [Aminobacter aminovorans]|uniref:Uncharacterized protein n=1 Tax=Aminobacter aminovorans TaxID=83263 RepID=A0A380WHJ0_AMIAI|nr:hypothetical protein EDC40_104592 [Aminobacter aminovorans]SUU87822.1 Uncharacterised protein [Aminobacter aminovorans]